MLRADLTAKEHVEIEVFYKVTGYYSPAAEKARLPRIDRLAAQPSLPTQNSFPCAL
jgi:hypothetical protein